jgi:DNA polymerase III epsilon subunit-like protein
VQTVCDGGHTATVQSSTVASQTMPGPQFWLRPALDPLGLHVAQVVAEVHREIPGVQLLTSEDEVVSQSMSPLRSVTAGRSKQPIMRVKQTRMGQRCMGFRGVGTSLSCPGIEEGFNQVGGPRLDLSVVLDQHRGMRDDSQQWTQMDWLVLAIQTTGPDPSLAAIWDLAAVSFRDGQMVHKAGMRVDPGHPPSRAWHEAQGLRDGALVDRPSIQSVGDPFLDRVRRAEVIVVFGYPTVDAFLQTALPSWREAVGDTPVLDPLVVLQLKDVGRYWKGRERYELGHVCERFGLPVTSAPGRAWTRAEQSGQVLWRFRNRLPSDVNDAGRFITDQRLTQQVEHRHWRRGPEPS